MDELGTVYFEKNISRELMFPAINLLIVGIVHWLVGLVLKISTNRDIILCVIISTPLALGHVLYTHSETESQLYVVRNVADGSQPVIFDPNLGIFMKNTFVLELEYMFVQVS